MNIILLESDDFIGDTTVRLSGRRFEHASRVLKVTVGDSVKVGLRGGKRGVATVTQLSPESIDLSVTLTDEPAPRHPFTLVLALPRPKMLRRVLRTSAEFGVRSLHLIHSYRVEKSYWQSPLLAEERLADALQAGMERSGDTLCPHIVMHRRFRPFIEDALPGIADGRPIFLAHPGEHPKLGADEGQEAVVMIGPEGGFIPFELELAQTMGAQLRHMGSRILSVDTALNSALARELH